VTVFILAINGCKYVFHAQLLFYILRKYFLKKQKNMTTNSTLNDNGQIPLKQVFFIDLSFFLQT